MNEERIRTLFSDEAFMRKLMEQDTPEQVQQLLLNHEIDLSIEEITKIAEMLEKHANGEINLEELSDDDLEDVSGGLVGSIVAISVMYLWAAAMVGAAAWIVDDTQRRNRRRW